MEHLEHLFSLQNVDRAIVVLDKESSESEKAKRVTRLQKAVNTCERKSRDLQERIQTRRRELRSFEGDLAGVESDLSTLEAKLFGGEVQNPKELAGLNERLLSGKRTKSELEEKVLECLEAIEGLEAELGDSDTEIKRLTDGLRKAQKALGVAQKSWQVERERLERERASLRNGVEASWLKKYDSLHGRHAGRPVAKVENRTCTGCHVTLPTSAKASESAYCPNCGRLLWWG